MTTKTYELKDFCVNLIGLSDYFMHVGQFANAEYCLYAAHSILPEDQKKKKKLRANLCLSLGQYYQVLLTFLVLNWTTQEKNEIPEEAQKKTIQFPEVDVVWPVIKPINGYQDAVSIFKLGNT